MQLILVHSLLSECEVPHVIILNFQREKFAILFYNHLPFVHFFTCPIRATPEKSGIAESRVLASRMAGPPKRVIEMQNLYIFISGFNHHIANRVGLSRLARLTVSTTKKIKATIRC